MNDYGHVTVDRDELAKGLVEKLENPVNRWWHAREWNRMELEFPNPSPEPQFEIRAQRPVVLSLGHVLSHVLTEYSPGQDVQVVELLEWIDRYLTWYHEDGQRHAHRGYGRAQSVVREVSGLGYPDNDPIMGELLPDGGTRFDTKEEQ